MEHYLLKNLSDSFMQAMNPVIPTTIETTIVVGLAGLSPLITDVRPVATNPQTKNNIVPGKLIWVSAVFCWSSKFMKSSFSFMFLDFLIEVEYITQFLICTNLCLGYFINQPLSLDSWF